MNLGPHPESVCVHLEIPFQTAICFADAPDEISSRHQVEKSIQGLFQWLQMDAYVAEGGGTVLRGHIKILARQPAPALRELLRFFKSFNIQGTQTDLLPFVHLGWFDAPNELWRTFHPRTTRPFWTLLQEPEIIAAIMEAGKGIQA